MAKISSYEKLLVAVHRTLKKRLLAIPRKPYRETIQRKRGGSKRAGTYIIFDQLGEVCYVGLSDDIRTRLKAHLHPTDYLMGELLSKEGLSPKIEAGHRCACGVLIPCQTAFTELNRKERQQSFLRLQDRILDTYTVAILDHSDRDTRALGRRELEALVQYLLEPRHGFVPHRTKGQIPIREHVAEHPTPAKLANEMEG